MREVGIFEGKTHFSALVTEVEGGEEIVITRNGKPVAKLSPIDAGSRSRAQEAMARLLAMDLSLGMPIRDAIEEGRRY